MKILIVLNFVTFAQCFTILDLKNVKTKMEPKKCSNETKIVAIIHSAPDNFQLREAIRKSWGVNIKTIFVLGKNSDLKKKLKKEHEKYKDILQFSFKDSYKNLTYKHLSGYKWISKNCQKTEFVLKTDDDQAVDIHHLKSYLSHFLDGKTQENFYLCYLIEKQKPQRSIRAKHFVSFQEYPEEYYPNFCSGWAYVTNINTIENLLHVSKEQKYFWIDDLYITGMLPKRFLPTLKYFQWNNNFLNDHIQHKNEILEGNFFTPELMVGSDLSPKEIETLSQKFQKCHRKKCYDKIYSDPQMTNYLKPNSQKTEL